jgi:hypothetical protein
VSISRDWLVLHRARFRQLPLCCGNELDPGVVYNDDLRDWSDKATTPDQRRMEHYIDRYDNRNSRILHVGVGNSELANRFHNRVKEIVGTTIDYPEIAVANSMKFPNYQVVMHNKFLGDTIDIHGKFEFILDNNPTSPCCCIGHLADLLNFYVRRLAPGGQIITDLGGLNWVPDGQNPRWRFSFDDLAAAGAAAGLCAFRANNKVCILAQCAVRKPGVRALLRYAWRQAVALPGKIVRKGPRVVARFLRELMKHP